MGADCKQADCDTTLATATACPGKTVQVDLLFNCINDCLECGGLDESVSLTRLDVAPNQLPVAVGGLSASCSDGKFTLSVTPDATETLPGEVYRIGFDMSGPGLSTCSATLTVKVAGADIVFPNLDEAVEDLSPGGIILRNNDDDNSNDVADLDETNFGDDNLIPLTLKVPNYESGEVRLFWVQSGEARLRVYENIGGSWVEITSWPKIWSSWNGDKTILVEGIKASVQPGSETLRLRYFPTGQPGFCADNIALTVIEADFDIEMLDDAAETAMPGFRLATNNDFDEGKYGENSMPLADYNDTTPATADGSAIAFTGLIPCAAFVSPQDDATLMDAVITFEQTAGSGSVRVLAIRPNASAPFDDDWVSVPLGSNLRNDYYLSAGQYSTFDCYIEPLTPGPVELALRVQQGSADTEDKVLLNVVEYGIVEIRYKTY